MSSQIDHEETVVQISHNLKEVQNRMADAAERANRKIDEIQLVAVTKMMPLEIIRAGIEAGLHCFGENYPEQAAEKIIALKDYSAIEWHMIGHIQSRKTETVVEYFDSVHSLDRFKIAKYLDRYGKEKQKIMPVLMEVNLSGEASKYGWDASQEEDWSSLIPEFRRIAELSNVEIRGLMTMPPLFDDPELTRPIYQKLMRLQVFLMDKLPEIHWDELSSGTSFDFEIAIEEGSTMVRIGTEIFGAR